MAEREDHLVLWDALRTPATKDVKGFKRAGGFSGHAVRPIASIRKMTEEFGPCGSGWRTGEPQFQVIQAGNEMAVYCTVALYAGGDAIWGVGGDMVMKETKYGLKADDEAFKKAYTDALTNAMKYLGMAADVHEGRFDDSKYVAELRREETQMPPSPQAPSEQSLQHQIDKGLSSPRLAYVKKLKGKIDAAAELTDLVDIDIEVRKAEESESIGRNQAEWLRKEIAKARNSFAAEQEDEAA